MTQRRVIMDGDEWLAVDTKDVERVRRFEDARALVHSAAADDGGHLLAELSRYIDVSPWAAVGARLDAIAEALTMGRLVVVRVHEPLRPMDEVEIVDLADLAEDPWDDEDQDWIEILVLDEEGNPVPDAEYSIRMPDGAERRARLNVNGVARHDAIPTGTCLVRVFGDDVRE